MDADADLATRVARGDQTAMTTFVERYQPLVQRVVFRLVYDPRDREEVCQDALVRALRHIHAWRGDARLATWVARIAHRAALQRLRRRRMPLIDDVMSHLEGHNSTATERLADERPDPHDTLERRVLEQRVRTVVGGLPPLYRSAVTMYYLEEMSVGEVAAAMDLPPGTVKSYLFRAREQLRHILAE